MTNKKLTTVTLLITTLLILSSCNSFNLSKDNKNTNNSNKIIATYQGGKVTLLETEAEFKRIVSKNNNLKDLNFKDLTADQREVIIKQVILSEISYKEAKKRNLNKEADYKKAIKFIETELLQQKLYAHLIKKATTEENLKKRYDELVKKMEGKKEIRIRYIVLKSKKQADKLSSKLIKSPKYFNYQAKKKSLDKETAKKGGDLGFILEDQLPTQVKEIASSLKKGQVSKAFPLDDKWIIIKLEEKRNAQIAKFEDAKPALIQDLSQSAIKDFIANSLEEARISIVVQ